MFVLSRRKGDPMPLFHFHIVTPSDRERIGSLDLPASDDVISAGLRLTTQILAGGACEKGKREGWVVQVTDEAGGVVYDFTVSPGSKSEDRPFRTLH